MRVYELSASLRWGRNTTVTAKRQVLKRGVSAHQSTEADEAPGNWHGRPGQGIHNVTCAFLSACFYFP